MPRRGRRPQARYRPHRPGPGPIRPRKPARQAYTHDWVPIQDRPIISLGSICPSKPAAPVRTPGCHKAYEPDSRLLDLNASIPIAMNKAL
jgi:hypothetical protein